MSEYVSKYVSKKVTCNAVVKNSVFLYLELMMNIF